MWPKLRSKAQHTATTEVAADAMRRKVAAYAAAITLVAGSAEAEDATASAQKSGAETLTAALEAERACLRHDLPRFTTPRSLPRRHISIFDRTHIQFVVRSYGLASCVSFRATSAFTNIRRSS